MLEVCLHTVRRPSQTFKALASAWAFPCLTVFEHLVPIWSIVFSLAVGFCLGNLIKKKKKK